MAWPGICLSCADYAQGALRLLAIPDVRMLLEDGGLDWKALQAVAAGAVEPGTEVWIFCTLPVGGASHYSYVHDRHGHVFLAY